AFILHVMQECDPNGYGGPYLAMSNASLSVDYVSVLPGRGDGTFSDQVRVRIGGGSGAFASADFDGDGLGDFFLVQTEGVFLEVLGQQALSQAGPFLVLPAPMDVSPAALVTDDVNNDGRLDVVTAVPNGGAVKTALGRGDGTLQPAVPLPVGTSSLSVISTDPEVLQAVLTTGHPRPVDTYPLAVGSADLTPPRPPDPAAPHYAP